VATLSIASKVMRLSVRLMTFNVLDNLCSPILYRRIKCDNIFFTTDLILRIYPKTHTGSSHFFKSSKSEEARNRYGSW